MRLLRSLLSRLRPVYDPRYLAQDVQFHRTTKVFWEERLVLGRYIYAGPNCMFNAEGGIEIGDGTIFGPEVVVLSSTHDFRTGEMMPYDIYDRHKRVTIGRGVWIGYRALICPGINIGDGAVVAMGAVVTRDVTRGEIVGGNPAVSIGARDPQDLAQRLAYPKWYIAKTWNGVRRRKRTD